MEISISRGISLHLRLPLRFVLRPCVLGDTIHGVPQWKVKLFLCWEYFPRVFFDKTPLLCQNVPSQSNATTSIPPQLMVLLPCSHCSPISQCIISTMALQRVYVGRIYNSAARRKLFKHSSVERDHESSWILSREHWRQPRPLWWERYLELLHQLDRQNNNIPLRVTHNKTTSEQHRLPNLCQAKPLLQRPKQNPSTWLVETQASPKSITKAKRRILWSWSMIQSPYRNGRMIVRFLWPRLSVDLRSLSRISTLLSPFLCNTCPPKSTFPQPVLFPQLFRMCIHSLLYHSADRLWLFVKQTWSAKRRWHSKQIDTRERIWYEQWRRVHHQDLGEWYHSVYWGKNTLSSQLPSATEVHGWRIYPQTSERQGPKNDSMGTRQAH